MIVFKSKTQCSLILLHSTITKMDRFNRHASITWLRFPDPLFGQNVQSMESFSPPKLYHRLESQNTTGRALWRNIKRQRYANANVTPMLRQHPKWPCDLRASHSAGMAAKVNEQVHSLSLAAIAQRLSAPEWNANFGAADSWRLWINRFSSKRNTASEQPLP